MEINGIDANAFRQYESIRLSGLTNMFDLKKVTEIAEDWDLTVLLDVIDDGYYTKIMRNYSAAKKAGII